VIVGGESGPGARPMHPEWVRSIRDQCQAAGVPFFFKQWGEWSPFCAEAHYADGNFGGECGGPGSIAYYTKPPTVSMRGHERRCDVVTVKEHCWGKGDALQMTYCRVGKKAAGRLLDGREWNELPEGRTT